MIMTVRVYTLGSGSTTAVAFALVMIAKCVSVVIKEATGIPTHMIETIAIVQSSNGMLTNFAFAL